MKTRTCVTWSIGDNLRKGGAVAGLSGRGNRKDDEILGMKRWDDGEMPADTRDRDKVR